ncbi:MAG: HEPN domain-containing protein [Sulfolobales archaeon]
MVSRYRDWLRQAERNFASAIVNKREGLYEESCYESHQAAEKALKALLNFYNKERRGHSLLYLIRELGMDIPGDVRECVLFLDKQYIPTRYPNAYDEGAPLDYYTVGDAEECIRCAERVLNWVKSLVR